MMHFSFQHRLGSFVLVFFFFSESHTEVKTEVCSVVMEMLNTEKKAQAANGNHLMLLQKLQGDHEKSSLLMPHIL